MKIRILIMPKEGLLDPQGRAVEELLLSKGIDAKNVRVGKVIEMEVDNENSIEDAVNKYLVNPLIEDFKIERL